jgi:hypothetical protein
MLTCCLVSLGRWMRLPRVQASGALQVPRGNVTVTDDLPCRPNNYREQWTVTKGGLVTEDTKWAQHLYHLLQPQKDYW